MHRALHLAVTMAVGCLAACTPGSGPDPSSDPAPPSFPDIAGTWTGSITVEGQPIDGTLEIDQDTADLTGIFTAPALRVSAEGAGTISAAGEMHLVLSYDLQCPGTAEMVGSRSPDGTSLTGALEAADCTGAISGSFAFRR